MLHELKIDYRIISLNLIIAVITLNWNEWSQGFGKGLATHLHTNWLPANGLEGDLVVGAFTWCD